MTRLRDERGGAGILGSLIIVILVLVAAQYGAAKYHWGIDPLDAFLTTAADVVDWGVRQLAKVAG